MNLISPRSSKRQPSTAAVLEQVVTLPLGSHPIREVPVGLDGAGICSAGLVAELLGKSPEVDELSPLPFLTPDAAKRRARDEEEGGDEEDEEGEDEAAGEEEEEAEDEEEDDLEDEDDDDLDDEDLDDEDDDEDEDEDDEEFDDPDEEDDFDDDDDDDDFDDDDE